jgi:hypothetical protein
MAGGGGDRIQMGPIGGAANPVQHTRPQKVRSLCLSCFSHFKGFRGLDKLVGAWVALDNDVSLVVVVPGEDGGGLSEG